MTGTANIQVRRIYDPPEATDGRRVLVDRLWPRGVSKQRAALSEWCRDVGPSTALRRWYGHAPEKYDEFARRYRDELRDAEHADALDRLRALADDGPLTLLTASKRDDISEATVLQGLLDEPPRLVCAVTVPREHRAVPTIPIAPQPIDVLVESGKDLSIGYAAHTAAQAPRRRAAISASVSRGDVAPARVALMFRRT